MRNRPLLPLRRKKIAVAALTSATAISAIAFSPLITNGTAPHLGLAGNPLHQKPLPQSPHQAPTPSSINQVNLTKAPELALNLIESGLAQAGVSLPPISLSQLNQLPFKLPPGLIPTHILEKLTPAPAGKPSTLLAAAPVKEITSNTPFSMVAVNWQGIAPNLSALVRAKKSDNTWGPWVSADPIGKIDNTLKQGTEPVWVGATSAVQIALANNGLLQQLSTPVAAPATPAGLDISKLIQTAQATLINPGNVDPAALVPNPGLPSVGGISVNGSPNFIPRAAWGGGNNNCGIAPALKGAVVHHSAGSNDYTPEQSVAIVRGIYAYHTQTLNWCDIGYNFLVDKYGTIFEGAGGGIDRNVSATHTGGFNDETVGAAWLGNLNELTPPPAMVSSMGKMLGWRLKLAGLDPNGGASITSVGFSTSRFPAGAVANNPMISGHRDYNLTECPGQFGYAALPEVRAIASGATGGANPITLAINNIGAIAQEWLKNGGPAGMIGAARSVELPVNGHPAARRVEFNAGEIYWSPQTGPQVIRGQLQQAFHNLGGAPGALGLPTSPEINQGTVINQYFQNGQLIFDPVTGLVAKILNK